MKKKRKKEFDAVKMMREIREKNSLEIKDMSFEELWTYIDLKLSKKARLIGKH